MAEPGISTWSSARSFELSAVKLPAENGRQPSLVSPLLRKARWPLSVIYNGGVRTIGLSSAGLYLGALYTHNWASAWPVLLRQPACVGRDTQSGCKARLDGDTVMTPNPRATEYSPRHRAPVTDPYSATQSKFDLAATSSAVGSLRGPFPRRRPDGRRRLSTLARGAHRPALRPTAQRSSRVRYLTAGALAVCALAQKYLRSMSARASLSRVLRLHIDGS